VDFSGLGTEGKELTAYRDAPEGTGCQLETVMKVPAGGKLPVTLRPGGGFIGHLQAPQTFTGWK
jgi:hypothetical protein